MKLDSNMLLGIFIAIMVLAFVYYLNQNNDMPIKNQGSIMNDQYNPNLETRYADDVRGDLVDDLISQYSDAPLNSGGTGTFSPADPMAEKHGSFKNYGRKRQINTRKMEQPFCDDKYDHRDSSYMPKRMERQPLDQEDNYEEQEYDPRDFTYKKNKFTKRTYKDIDDQFDVEAVLPQEIEQDWFDITPLQTTQKIKGTHLIHPKVHMGVNTVASTLRNGTHDIRGDIVNPKLNVGPWMQSTIEPDTNIKGLCNPI